MTTLTDYLDPAALQQVQDIFTLVTRAPVRVYGADGQPLTQPSELVAAELTSLGVAVANPETLLSLPDNGHGGAALTAAPIVVDGQAIGRIILERPSQTRWPARQMAALAEALGIPMSRLRKAIQQVPEVDAETSLSALRMLHLMADVIRRLCDQEQQLRARVEELGTLYRITSLFTAQRDLTQVLNTVARTVVDVMRVKGCTIRMLDDEKQEMVPAAVANLSEEYLNKGPVPLARSQLDTEAYATQDVVYVEDEQTDPRVLYPAEAKREGLVSALIVPMIYKDRPIGSIRLYTGQKHRFTSYEVGLVKAIAAQAAAAAVNARLYQETLTAENVRRQVRVAGEVQRRMIPAQPPRVRGLDIAAVYVPSLELSGDFYDFIELPEGNLGVAVCDVMGKGIPASLLMASIRASLRAHASHIYALSDVLGRVNRSLCDDTLISDFATLFYGVINTHAMQLTYANAGHEPPILLRGGQISRLTSGGTVLGIERNLRYVHEVVQLQRGDVLLLVTDGLIEAMNFRFEMFGRPRVEAAALAAIGRGADANGIAQHVVWEMRRFTGLQARPDDLTVLVIRAV